MATLMIDGRAHSGEKPLKTVGDLVAAADDWLARSGRIVTELRLDGVDEPAFREPQIVGQSASAYSEVQIESGTRADLALRCLHEAGDALKSLAEAADSRRRSVPPWRDRRSKPRAGSNHGWHRDCAGDHRRGVARSRRGPRDHGHQRGHAWRPHGRYLSGAPGADQRAARIRLGRDGGHVDRGALAGAPALERRVQRARAAKSRADRRYFACNSDRRGWRPRPEAPNLSGNAARPARNRTAHRQAVRQSVCFRDRERDQ